MGEYMRRCDRLLEKADLDARWETASKQLVKTSGELFGDKKPEWNDPLPE
jgi:hypothetical protein